jgi:hypothetical protein
VLQRLMRHSSIALTMSYHANVDDAAMQALLEREPLLRNTPPEAAKDRGGANAASPRCD